MKILLQVFIITVLRDSRSVVCCEDKFKEECVCVCVERVLLTIIPSVPTDRPPARPDALWVVRRPIGVD